MSPPSIDNWFGAARTALGEIAQEALGLPTIKTLTPESSIPHGRMGSYVPIISEDSCVHVGLMSNQTGCEALTRALLGMEEEEVVDPADMTDAIGEIANMLAGGVKRIMIERAPKLQLGLPIFINGHIEVGAAVEALSTSVEVDPTAVVGLVVHMARR